MDMCNRIKTKLTPIQVCMLQYRYRFILSEKIKIIKILMLVLLICLAIGLAFSLVKFFSHKNNKASDGFLPSHSLTKTCLGQYFNKDKSCIN